MGRTIADLLINISADNSEVEKKLKDTQKKVDAAFSPKTLGISSNVLAGVAAGVAAVGASLSGLGAYCVKAAGGFQNVQVAMTNMLGSGEKAQAFLQDLQEFAARTPFEFNGLAQSSQKLLAFGFTAEQIIPTMTAIGDAAAALGAGQEGVDRITMALGQMAAKGKIQSEEMLQLTEAGIPAWQLLADTIGTSIPEAMDMVSKGQVNAQIGLSALVNGMEQQFGGLMEQQSKTILGGWANLMDGLDQSAVAVGLKIADAFDLPDIFSSIGESFSKFAKTVNSSGITKALGELIPPELEVALYGVAGVIAYTVYPAFIKMALGAAASAVSMAASAAATIVAWAPVIATGVALGLVIGLICDPVDVLTGLFYLLGFSTEDATKYGEEFGGMVQAAIDWVVDGIKAIGDFIMQFTALGAAIKWATNALANFFATKGKGEKGEKVEAPEGSEGDDKEGILDRIKKKFQKQTFENFGGGAGGGSIPSFGGGGGGSVGGAGGGIDRMAQEAERTSKQLADEYDRLFETATEGVQKWYQTELDTLEKSKEANKNYQDDLTKLNAIYEQKRRKAQQDEANEQIRLYDKVHSAALESLSLANAVNVNASTREILDMEAEYKKSIDNIQKRWQAFEIDYLGSTDKQRKALLKQLDAQGVAYKVYEDGRLSLAEQTNADIANAEKAYNDKRVKYYAQAKDIQTDIDEAYAKNSISLLKATLNAENGARLVAFNEQKDLIDTFYDNWKEANRTTTDKIIGTIKDTKGSFDTFFSDVLTGSQSFLDSLKDLFSNVWSNIVSNFTQSWSASLSNGLLSLFGMGQDSQGNGSTGGGIGGAIGGIASIFGGGDSSGGSSFGMMDGGGGGLFGSGSFLGGSTGAMTTGGDTSGGGLFGGDSFGGSSFGSFGGGNPLSVGAGSTSGGGSLIDVMNGFSSSVMGASGALMSNASTTAKATSILGMFAGSTQKGSQLLGAYNTIQGILNMTTKPQETATTVTASTALGLFTNAVIEATIALKAMKFGGGFFFASGGYIQGAGTSTSDSIPANLSNGEYVLNAKAVKKLGVPLLNTLNSGKIPAFANGGLVSRPRFNTVGMGTLERAFNAVAGGNNQNVNVSQNIYGDINTGADSEELMADFSSAVLAGLRGS